MKLSSAGLLAFLSADVDAFLSPLQKTRLDTVKVFSSLKEDPTKEETKQDDSLGAVGDDVEGLPWWWELVWDLDIMKKGTPGEEIIFGDSANVLRTNIEQIYGGFPSLDGCPIAEGELNDIADGTMFVGLQSYEKKYKSPYKVRWACAV
jgi:hypothetical protein